MTDVHQHPFPPRVLRPHDLPSIDRGNGATTTPLVTRAIGATAFLNGITSFSPGAAIGHHMHNCVESVMVIEGSAFVNIDGVETALATGDTTFVPANVAHHFRNASDEHQMKILWTYASIDATRTMVASGETGRVDAEQGSGAAERSPIVLEVVELDVLPTAHEALLDAVAEAAPYFQRAVGCRSFELFRSAEDADSYRLLIEWTTLEDHTVGFRESADFAEWRRIIMPHLSGPPRAGHLTRLSKAF